MPNDSDASQPTQEPSPDVQAPAQSAPPEQQAVAAATGDDQSALEEAASATQADDEAADESGQTFSWVAKEFVHHEKTMGWYVLLAGVAIVLSALVYLLTKDIVSIAVIIVGALLLLYYGAKAPNDITYTLSSQGVTIGNRYYGYENFRSFSVLQEGSTRNIVFMPQKRFSLLVSIYYQPSDEEMIVGLLSSILPLTEFSHDAIDRLMHNIRF